MIGPHNPNSYITQDNSKLRKEVANTYDMGMFKFNNGRTADEKNEGINQLLISLKKLKLWIDREGNQ